MFCELYDTMFKFYFDVIILLSEGFIETERVWSRLHTYYMYVLLLDFLLVFFENFRSLNSEDIYLLNLVRRLTY